MGRVTSFFTLGTTLLALALYQTSQHHHFSDLIRSFSWSNAKITDEPEYTPSARLLSTDPLLVYIDHFLDSTEIQYLITLGTPLFQRSMITDGKFSVRRTSDSCFLSGNDTVVSRIKQRAATFMGGVPYDGMEAVQLVRYVENQKVDLHYDWHQGKLPVSKKSGKSYNRLASFFIYIDASCKGGETWFPNVTVSKTLNAGHVRTIDDTNGISVVPKAGNGVFWMNMDRGGTGDRRTLHAGLPVKSGTKIGMNIWIMKNVDNADSER